MGKICDPPTFSGGQCNGILYNVFVESLLRSQDSQDRFAGTNYGDISGGGGVKGYMAPISYGYEVSADRKTINIWVQEKRYRDSIVQSVNGVGGAPLSLDSFWRITKVERQDKLPDTCGNLPSNCRCSNDSCRVDCSSAPDGFCCIDHSLTDRLLQVLQN